MVLFWQLMSALLVIMLSKAAFASGIGNVGGSSIKAGRQSIEWRTSVQVEDESNSQDQRVRTRLHYQYAPTGWYNFRIIGAGDKRENDNLEFDSAGMEHWFQFLEDEQDGLDATFRVTYSYKDEDKGASSLGLNFTAQQTINKWEWRINQIFGHEVGPQSSGGITPQTRFQITHAIDENFKLGAGWFSNFGKLSDNLSFQEQSHSFGPVLKGKLGDGYFFQTGYRTGLSQGAEDHLVKFFIGRNF